MGWGWRTPTGRDGGMIVQGTPRKTVVTEWVPLTPMPLTLPAALPAEHGLWVVYMLYTCCWLLKCIYSTRWKGSSLDLSVIFLPASPTALRLCMLKLVLYCHRGHIQFCTFYLQSLELRGQCYHEAPHENTVELVVLCSQETWELAAQLRVWWLASYLKAKATSWMWAQLLSTFQRKREKKLSIRNSSYGLVADGDLEKHPQLYPGNHRWLLRWSTNYRWFHRFSNREWEAKKGIKTLKFSQPHL